MGVNRAKSPRRRSISRGRGSRAVAAPAREDKPVVEEVMKDKGDVVWPTVKSPSLTLAAVLAEERAAFPAPGPKT